MFGTFPKVPWSFVSLCYAEYSGTSKRVASGARTAPVSTLDGAFFLNLCWIALLLPAYTLWRQRVLPNRAARTSLVFSCALGCVLVLLFPVISASDDLHSTGQVMEESKRATSSRQSRQWRSPGGRFPICRSRQPRSRNASPRSRRKHFPVFAAPAGSFVCFSSKWTRSSRRAPDCSQIVLVPV